MRLEKIDLSFLCKTEAYKQFLTTQSTLIECISNSKSKNTQNIEYNNEITSLFEIDKDTFKVTIDTSPSPAFYLKGVSINKEGFLVSTANSVGPVVVLSDLRKEFSGKYVDLNNKILDLVNPANVSHFSDEEKDAFLNGITTGGSGAANQVKGSTMEYTDLDGYSIFRSLVESKLNSPVNFLDAKIIYKFFDNESSEFNRKFAWLIALSTDYHKVATILDSKNVEEFALNTVSNFSSPLVSDVNIKSGERTDTVDNFKMADTSSLGVILSKYTMLSIWLSYIMNSNVSGLDKKNTEAYLNSDMLKTTPPILYESQGSIAQMSQYNNRYPIEGIYFSKEPVELSCIEKALEQGDESELSKNSFYTLYKDYFTSDKGFNIKKGTDEFLDTFSRSISGVPYKASNFIGNYKGRKIDIRTLSYCPIIYRESLDSFIKNLNLSESDSLSLNKAYNAMGSLFNKNTLFCGSYDYSEFLTANVDKTETLPLAASSVTDWGYSLAGDDDVFQTTHFTVATKYSRVTNGNSIKASPYLKHILKGDNINFQKKLYNVTYLNTILEAQRSLGFSNKKMDKYWRDLNLPLYKDDSKISGEDYSITNVINDLVTNTKYGRNAIYFSGINDFINPFSIKTENLNLNSKKDLDESSPFFTLDNSKSENGTAFNYLKVISEDDDVSRFVDGRAYIGTALYLRNLGSNYEHLFTESLFKIDNKTNVKQYVADFTTALDESYNRYLNGFIFKIIQAYLLVYKVFRNNKTLESFAVEIQNKLMDNNIDINLNANNKMIESDIKKLLPEISKETALELSRWFIEEVSSVYYKEFDKVINSPNKNNILFRGFGKISYVIKQIKLYHGYIDDVYQNYINIKENIDNAKTPTAMKSYISNLYDNSVKAAKNLSEVKDTLKSMSVYDVDLIDLDNAIIGSEGKSYDDERLADLEGDLGLSLQVMSTMGNMNYYKNAEEVRSIIQKGYSDSVEHDVRYWSDEDNIKSDSEVKDMSWGNKKSTAPLLKNVKELMKDSLNIDRVLQVFSIKMETLLNYSGASDLLEAVSSKNIKKYKDVLYNQFNSLSDKELANAESDLSVWDDEENLEGDINSESITFMSPSRLKYISRFLLRSDLHSILDINKNILLVLREFVFAAFSGSLIQSPNVNKSELLHSLAKSLSFNQDLKLSINPVRTKAFCMSFVNLIRLHRNESKVKVVDITSIVQNLYFILFINLIYKALLYYRAEVFYSIAQSEGGNYIPPVKGKIRSVLTDVYDLYTKYFNPADGSLLIDFNDVSEDNKLLESILSVDYVSIHDRFIQSLRVLSSFVGGLIDDINFDTSIPSNTK